MERKFTLEYWIDDDWYVGRLREVPSVFSQGATLAEMEDNIQDAYRMMTEDTSVSLPSVEIREKEVSFHV